MQTTNKQENKKQNKTKQNKNKNKNEAKQTLKPKKQVELIQPKPNFLHKYVKKVELFII